VVLLLVTLVFKRDNLCGQRDILQHYHFLKQMLIISCTHSLTHSSTHSSTHSHRHALNLDQHESSKAVSQLLSGFLAGVFGAGLNTPCDTIRSNVQKRIFTGY
jgi:hypothetical protein